MPDDIRRTCDRVSPLGLRDVRVGLCVLRRLSGLTWGQLARVFGASRRTLHLWASGKPLNATNEEHLHRVLAALRRADRGTAQANRAMLLTERSGTVPIALLAESRYDEFLRLVGEGRGRRTLVRRALSSEAREARKPLPPEELIDALQDPVHLAPRKGRRARTGQTGCVPEEEGA